MIQSLAIGHGQVTFKERCSSYWVVPRYSIHCIIMDWLLHRNARCPNCTHTEIHNSMCDWNSLALSQYPLKQTADIHSVCCVFQNSSIQSGFPWEVLDSVLVWWVFLGGLVVMFTARLISIVVDLKSSFLWELKECWLVSVDCWCQGNWRASFSLL